MLEFYDQIRQKNNGQQEEKGQRARGKTGVELVSMFRYISVIAVK
ncbi:hypothetical protein FDUTEX481_00264 [Tolypothrix sp. PCC 7601]|nr:hypothetical protein FDUTEX481_00264 [Tolypothrix sp. PCC 7601]